MELFPAQPDLSLQISPPNTKPTSSWSRRDHQEADLGFWRSSMDSNKATPSSRKPDTASDLSLANPKALEPSSNHIHPLHPKYHTLLAPPQLQQKYHHHQEGLHQQIGFLRPIRGIPIYQSTPPSFSFPHQHSLDSSPSTISTTCFNSNGLQRSRFISRFPTKRSMRAPRMRWTTTLHARFVHAVELLGGHESMLNFPLFVSLIDFDSQSPLQTVVGELPSLKKSKKWLFLWFRSYTQVSSWAHGCEGSHFGSCEIPFTGKKNEKSVHSKWEASSNLVQFPWYFIFYFLFIYLFIYLFWVCVCEVGLAFTNPNDFLCGKSPQSLHHPFSPFSFL